MGIAPFWGFQSVLILFMAHVLKLNKAIAFAFSNISIPPFIPLIIYGSLLLGRCFIHADKPLFLNNSITFGAIGDSLAQYIVGSFLLATLMGILFGVVGYVLMLGAKTMKSKSYE